MQPAVYGVFLVILWASAGLVVFLGLGYLLGRPRIDSAKRPIPGWIRWTAGAAIGLSGPVREIYLNRTDFARLTIDYRDEVRNGIEVRRFFVTNQGPRELEQAYAACPMDIEDETGGGAVGFLLTSTVTGPFDVATGQPITVPCTPKNTLQHYRSLPRLTTVTISPTVWHRSWPFEFEQSFRYLLQSDSGDLKWTQVTSERPKRTLWWRSRRHQLTRYGTNSSAQ